MRSGDKKLLLFLTILGIGEYDRILDGILLHTGPNAEMKEGLVLFFLRQYANTFRFTL